MEKFFFGTRPVLLPLVLLLALSGLYVRMLRPCSLRKVITFTICFSVWVLLTTTNSYLLVLNLLSVVSAAKIEIDSLIYLLLPCVGRLQNVYLSIFLTYSVSRHVTKWYKLLEEYCQKYRTRGRSLPLIIVCWLVCLAVFGGVLSASVYLTVVARNCEMVFDHHDLLSTVWYYLQCLFSRLTFYTRFLRPWVSSTLYVITWWVLFAEARRFNGDMHHHKFENAVCPALHVEHFRLRHLHLCRLVDTANVVLRHFLFTTYATGIPMLLLSVTMLFKNSMASLTTGLVIYTGIFNCAQMVAVTLTGAALSLEMHKPSGILSSLRIEQMAGKPYNAVSAFQSQLQSGPIGFHVYRLFTIDTSTILMICGTVLTYAVITIQFKPNEEDVVTNVTSANMSLH